MSDTTMIETKFADTAAEVRGNKEIALVFEMIDRAEIRPDQRLEVVTRLGDTLRILDIPDYDKQIDPSKRLVVQPENVYTAMLMRYHNERVTILQGEEASSGIEREFTDVFAEDGSGLTPEVAKLSATQPVKIVWERRFINRDNKEVLTSFEFTARDNMQEVEEPKFVIEKSIRPAQVGQIRKTIPVARKNPPKVIG